MVLYMREWKTGGEEASGYWVECSTPGTLN